MITSIQDFYEQQLDSLSVRARNVLRQNRINEYSTLLNMATKPGFSFMKLHKIGKKTTKELDELVNRLLEYQKINMNGDVNDEEKFVTDEQEETDVISKLNTPIVNLDISVRALNCLKEAEINTIGDLVAFNKTDLLHFRSLGKKTLQEIENIVETMGFQFGMEVWQLTQENDITPPRVPGIGVLSESKGDIDYIYAFKEKYGHFPMVFLLYKSSNILTEYEREVIKMYWGLSQSDNTIFPMTIDEIASKFFLTRERIRQILEKALKRIRTSGTIKNLFRYEDWRVYKIDMDAPCIFPENIDTNRILDEHNFLIEYIQQNRDEKWHMQFADDAPCISSKSLHLILLMKGFKPVWLDKDKKEISEQSHYLDSELPIAYVNDQLFKYNYNKAIKEVVRLQNIKKTEDVIIPINNYFIDNKVYWNTDASPTEIEKTAFLEVLIRIFQFLFGTIICKDCILFKANKIDYSQHAYEIIKEAGTRMHRDELFKRLNDVCIAKGLSINFSDSSQISTFLTKDPRIVPIGKSGYWGLKEWGESNGSIREIAIQLVKKTKQPIPISELAKLVIEKRPDSNEKSVNSIIRQTTTNGELVLFFDDYVGCPKRTYSNEYIIVPQTFDEWRQTFKNFVLKNKRFPYGGQNGYEGYLYRWYNKVSRLTDLSSEEILKIDALEKELSHYPHNATEYKFLQNCNLYRNHVERNHTLIDNVMDSDLYGWYYTATRNYHTYQDNRKKYFAQLLRCISEQLY